MRALLLLTLLAGCSSHVPPTAPQAVACPVSLVGSHLRVGPKDLGDFTGDPDTRPEQLAVYPAGDEAWVSYRDGYQVKGPSGANTMWKVSCKTGDKLDQLTVEGLDFGHAALHPDRKRMFVSSDGGVVELELATKAKTTITTPTTIASCWSAEDEAKPFQLRDAVVGVTADYVELQRGGPCGFEAEWEATMIRYHFATKREEHETPITSVAQAGPAALIAIAHNCDNELVRSTDWTTWTKVGEGKLHGPVTLMAEGTTVVAVSLPCGPGEGGGAMVSRDGGVTWEMLANLDDQVAWTRGTTLATFELATGDDFWKWNGTTFVDTGVAVGETTPPPAPAPVVTLGARSVELTTFGLLDAKTKQPLYPR